MSKATITAIDISEPTATICQRLGLEPADVAQLTWTPGRMEAVVYDVNDEGKHYVDDNGDAAQYTASYPIRA